MQTFAEFKTRLRAELWPGGEARSLRVSHDAYFNAAMLDIQKWVPCVRELNTSTWNFSDTKWENAKTVVNAPVGTIQRVYTVAGGTDRWRDKVKYRSSTYATIECWARHLYNAITPDHPAGLPELALGMRHADASSDSQYGRARIGIWAIERRRLYIAPYLQSTEMLVVDWTGIKQKWIDSDIVDETRWTGDYEEAVKQYVMWKNEHYHTRDRTAAADAKASYDAMLSDLMYWCRENTKQQPDHTCDAGGSDLVGLTTDRTGDDDEPTDDTTDEDNVLFDFVADVEATTEGEALAAAVESDNPELLIMGGDLGYAEDHGDSFETALEMYDWAKESGIIVPVIGNHEWIDSSYDLYLDYFEDELEGKNNGRFYDFVHGPLHGFVENRDVNEPDGYNNSSIQSEWLFAKGLLSVARWKMAFGHHPPYSSGSTYGSNAAYQRDYAGAGIIAVFAGHEHNAEHLLIGGVHYFVGGLGGRSKYAFGAAISGSLFRYNTLEARWRVRLDCDECVVELVNTADEIVYTYTIEHPDAEE